MESEKIRVQVTESGQSLDVVVLDKRADRIRVVVGTGVHSVRCELTPTRNGLGYAGTVMRGSAHNDAFVPGEQPGSIRTRTNRSGGIQGGISNGMPVELSVAFKPVATIFQEQDTVDREGRPARISPRGRHDPCVLPRAVPMVEAAVLLVLVDHWLRQAALSGS